MNNSPAWSLVVHGGCGQLSPDTLPGPEADCRAGLAGALAAGKAVLSAGGSAVDAVDGLELEAQLAREFAQRWRGSAGPRRCRRRERRKLHYVI